MSSAPSPIDPAAADPDLITLPDAAELLALPITKVHQLLKDGQLVVTRDAEGRRVLPRIFVVQGAPLKGLSSVITLLRDGGFSDAEIVEWLLRADDSLPGTPAQALAENRGTEVKRRAQAAAF
ncbi:MAG TPA: Rv2175c family DNA-binding protein [Jatrophihabitans sp.]|nr:Rv2175c family DNA-binding protein [Jatrophihabitans sp.]